MTLLLTRLRALLPLLALLLLGCPAHTGRVDSTDPLAGIRTAPSGYAIKGRMYLTIKAPRWDVGGTTSTTMIVHRPDDLFLQVRGPVNNVMVQGTANRQELVVVIPPANKAFTASNPDAAMKALTGGALGVDGLLSLLMARLPRQDLEVIETRDEGDDRVVILEAPGGYRVQATVNARRGRLRSLLLHSPDGQELMSARYEGWFRDARSFYPELVTIDIPGLELGLKADFQAWEVMGEVPSIFTTAVPAGAEVVDLEEALEQGVSLPPPSADAHPAP